MTDLKLAFLGLGTMGGAMAANLARAGFAVSGWNRTPNRPGVQVAAAAGAQIASSLAAAVADAEVIFSCVGDVPDVEAVLLPPEGAATGAKAGALVVDTSTIGPLAAQTVGRSLAAQGLRFLDAPVSGGDIGAQRGTLTFMVGGEAADFAVAQPYFAAMGAQIHHCGPVGSGQAVKMCNQILCAANLVGICEAMLLAEKMGLDPQQIVEVCGSGAAGSWALANLGEKVAIADFAPGFAIKHMLKDLRLVQANAAAVGQAIPGTAMAKQFFEQVQALGGDEQGTQAMIRAYHQPPPS
ncbi:MAG: NAD(P)-dependent oxidoreductase [Spirulinaceae cyanobacterium SM2_1_0]|nr:NAD(P)-dependent oxidoreductase [Spirulinaceae cyanobacterium SM2_1_0]